MLKKVKLGLTACVMLGNISSLFAGGSHVNFALTDNKINNGSGYIGGDFGVDMIKTFNDGIECGVAIDIDMFLVKKYQSLNDEAGEIADLLFRVGYNFNSVFQVPVALRGGIGYGVGQIGKNTMDGAVYDVEGEYDINTKYGVGLKYKKANMTQTLLNNPKLDYSQIGCYLTVKF